VYVSGTAALLCYLGVTRCGVYNWNIYKETTIQIIKVNIKIHAGITIEPTLRKN
jgi:hypothetical protein